MMTARLGANSASATIGPSRSEPASQRRAEPALSPRPATTATTPSPTAIITVDEREQRPIRDAGPLTGHVIERRPTITMRASAPLAAPLPPPAT